MKSAAQRRQRPLFSWWCFRFGLSVRVGHLLASVGVYPQQKFPADWRPVVVEWKGRSWPK